MDSGNRLQATGAKRAAPLLLIRPAQPPALKIAAVRCVLEPDDSKGTQRVRDVATHGPRSPTLQNKFPGYRGDLRGGRITSTL